MVTAAAAARFLILLLKTFLDVFLLMDVTGVERSWHCSELLCFIVFEDPWRLAGISIKCHWIL
jgi:hypothetical protein